MQGFCTKILQILDLWTDLQQQKTENGNLNKTLRYIISLLQLNALSDTLTLSLIAYLNKWLNPFIFIFPFNDRMEKTTYERFIRKYPLFP